MGKVAKHRLRFKPKGIEFNGLDGELLYESGKKAGIRFPVSCRNGVCHICKASLVSGRVDCGVAGVVDAAEPPDKEIMMCLARPLSDCEFRMEKVYDRGEYLVKAVVCKVLEVRAASSNIFKVELELPAGKPPEFCAGQYLELSIPERDISSYFSIASAPGTRVIELHIQADPHLTSAVELVGAIQDIGSVRITLPMGKACLPSPPEGELILMAAGTGFAQMKSIVEAMLVQEKCDNPVYLYWGVKTESDMYDRALAESWAESYKNFHFRPFISGSTEEGQHYEQLAKAVIAEAHQVGESAVFVSGSPKLVYTSMDIMEQEGFSSEQFFSDVFEYSPRPA